MLAEWGNRGDIRTPAKIRVAHRRLRDPLRLCKHLPNSLGRPSRGNRTSGMKRSLLILAAIIAISTSGCLRRQCNSCNGGGGGGGLQGRIQPQGPEFNQPGPPTAAVAYPYYTVRGPRDFFIDDPPTIGR
jgi:hypothetical protein